MFHCSSIRLLTILVGVLVSFHIGSQTAAALDYPFTVGQRIVYRVEAIGMGVPPSSQGYELWVLGERSPGEYRAVWCTVLAPGTPQEQIAGAIPVNINKQGAKTFPREREATYLLEEMLETFIPDLSRVTALSGTWKGPNTVTGRYHSYQVTGQENNLVKATIAKYGVDNMDQIVGILTSGQVYIDPQTNWQQTLSLATYQQTPEGQAKISEANVTLVETTQQPEEWRSQREQEALAFLNCISSHDQLLNQASDNLSSATFEVGPVRALWDSYLAANTQAVFTPLATLQSQRLTMELPVLQQLWLTRKQSVGKPAPAWSWSDLSGQPVSSDQYAGQPLLLVFWSRGNWDSLMALRELPAIMSAYQPRGLQTLAVSLYQRPEDSAESLRLLNLSNVSCLTLPDPAIMQSFGIPPQLIPAAVLIGPDGMIKDIRYGWGKNVYRQLRQKCELLFG